MKTLKTLTLTLAGALGLTLAASSASADLWKSEVIMGRDMTFYTPHELDRSGLAATPAVFIFDESASSGGDIAARFRLWEYAMEKGFKLVHVGGFAGRDGRGAPNHDQLFEAMMSRSAAEGFVDPNNAFVVGFGPAAGRALQYACANPGAVRGIVAIDFEGLDEAFTCENAAGLFVLSVHDGKPVMAGTSGAAPARDLSAVEDALAKVDDAGATVQRIALQGPDDRYPDIAAKFFDEKKVPLDKLSGTFIGRIMVK